MDFLVGLFSCVLRLSCEKQQNHLVSILFRGMLSGIINKRAENFEILATLLMGLIFSSVSFSSFEDMLPVEVVSFFAQQFIYTCGASPASFAARRLACHYREHPY